MPTRFRQLRNRIIEAISPPATAAAADTDEVGEDDDVEEEEEVDNEEEDKMDDESAEEVNADDEDDDTPPTSSPSRVILDLLDSTSHEIITLGGDMNSTDKFTMPAFESYVTLAQRLNYYMDLLIQGYPNADQQQLQQPSEQQEQPMVLEQGSDIWFRFVMAKWIVDVFTKVAYPDDYVDVIRNGRKQPRPTALMDTPPEGWAQMRQEFAEVSSMLNDRGEHEMEWERVQSLECAMEGFEALAKLREQLRDILDEIDSGANRNKPVSAFNFGCVIKYEEQYRVMSGKLAKRLEKSGSGEYYANLFVSMDEFRRKINAEQRPTTIEEWTTTISAILEEIEEAITDAEFPLNQFKIEFLDMLKDWEVTYLPKPALFKVGYFKYGEGDAPGAASTPRRKNGVAASGEKRVRHEPDRFSPSTPTRKSAASEASSPAKICSPIKKRLVKRACRVPFSDVEKECLRKGVARFGVGHWAKILHHYSDVFEVEDRNNIDLKDLYRNMTKKKK
ncbi:hypothetical protein ACHAXH_009618 [Discostella pseudostelligera]